MTPEDLYWKGRGNGMERSKEANLQLQEAAIQFSNCNNFLAAGIASADAVFAGWGEVDVEILHECSQTAVGYFEKCIETCSESDIEPLLAYQLLWRNFNLLVRKDRPENITATRSLQASKIAYVERIYKYSAGHKNLNSFLVRGCRLSGQISGEWTAAFPNYEIDPGESSFSHIDRILCYNLTSAFRVLVDIADYRGAWEICKHHIATFTSPGLQGWYYAVEAFTHPERAAYLFEKAAESLAEDTVEQKRDPGQGWSGINSQLWSPHFWTRSHLARALSDPQNIERHIQKATEHANEFKGWVSPNVARFDILIQTLAGMLRLKGGFDSEVAKEELAKSIKITGQREEDPVLFEFLDKAGEAFSKFTENRYLGITTLGRAVGALDRFSLLIQPEKEAVDIALGYSAVKAFEGISSGWIYRTLEGITDEKILHHILLRLFQNQVPLFAQIKHGPIEYGKDIVVVTEKDGINTLRMYQVKCGNIDKSNWKIIKPQLEEIFEVPLQSFQLPMKIDRRVGLLVWNGHANSYVDPVISGWATDQRIAHNREYEFLHIDSLINYIFDARLISSLREVLSELDVEID